MFHGRHFKIGRWCECRVGVEAKNQIPKPVDSFTTFRKVYRFLRGEESEWYVL